jgi:hypothetical protein
LPSVNKLYSDFKDRGLDVLLVDIREGPDLVKRTVRERGYVAPVLLDQSGDSAGKLWGVWGTPTAYLIDREGRLIGRIVGPRDWGGPQAREFIRALVQPDEKS